MRLLRRKRAEPEPVADEERSEEEAAEVAQAEPVYPLLRDEKGRYVSRKTRM